MIIYKGTKYSIDEAKFWIVEADACTHFNFARGLSVALFVHEYLSGGSKPTGVYNEHILNSVFKDMVEV